MHPTTYLGALSKRELMHKSTLNFKHGKQFCFPEFMRKTRNFSQYKLGSYVFYIERRLNGGIRKNISEFLNSNLGHLLADNFIIVHMYYNLQCTSLKNRTDR